MTMAQLLALGAPKLQLARKDYAASDLPADVRAARVAALDAKIAALRDVHANPVAHPWIGDL